MSQRGAQLGDSLEPLGAQSQRVDALLIGDVLEDGRRRSVEVTALAVGVRRGDADGKSPSDRRHESFCSRRPDLMHHGPLERVRQFGGDLADAHQHRLADVPAQTRA